jgi:tetratricopeptide (TPR) repeat protein
MDKPSNKYQTICICLALILTTLVAYWQVRNCNFINYDDPLYVSENEHVRDGITRDGIIWAFTTSHFYWHPLTWLSHMLDCQLFGLNPGRHHLVNLLFHIINALLLFGVLKQMTGAVWQSAFVAAAFALHPIHVESVAWIAERKSTLSTMFWMLTMAAYWRYVKGHCVSWYLLTLFVFALGLLVKPMLVTLPFVLLLLDYWPLGRIKSQIEKADDRHVLYYLIREKIPFFVLSAVSSIITFVILQTRGAKDFHTLSSNIRIANALVCYVRYIGKMIWPSNLALFYPHPGYKLPMSQGVVTGLLLAGITILVIRLAPRYKYLPVGWLWYLGTLIPVIGLVQVGDQAMADHFVYLPSLGIFMMVGWGAANLSAKWRHQNILLAISGVTVLGALLMCTRMQVRYWRDGVTVFQHSLQITGDNGVAHNGLGHALQMQGKLSEAISHYRLALQLEPNIPKAHNNLANALEVQGKVDEAISHYRQAIQIAPDFAEAYFNLGNVLRTVGRADEAIANYRQAVQARPEYAKAYNNLGAVFELQGKFDEAISNYSQALRIKPNYADAHFNLARIFQFLGRLDEAIGHYRQALLGNPNDAEVHSNLGSALQLQGKFDEALAHHRQSLLIKPDSLMALNGIAWILATCPDPNTRDAAQAIVFAERAAQLTTYQNPSVLLTLATAYAATGDYNRAVKTAEAALQFASANKDERLANQIRTHLKSYKLAKP